MQGLFNLFMSTSGVSDAELRLVERTIGAAMLDKARGHQSLPSQIYEAFGGSDSVANGIFSNLDEIWYKNDSTNLVKEIEQEIDAGVSFAEIYRSIPSPELSLIERTIGCCVLDKMRGIESSLLTTYQNIGGETTETQKVFTALSERWEKADFSKAFEHVK